MRMTTRNGGVKHNDLPLTLQWKVTLAGLSTQLGETGPVGQLRAASNLTATASVAAEWAEKGDAHHQVFAGFINILVSDYKEISFGHKENHKPLGGIRYKLSKLGPLWDPSDEALKLKNHVYPFSVPPQAISLDGKPKVLTPFVDSPRIDFDKKAEGQELFYVDGRTVFLIVLCAIVQDSRDRQTQDEIILFTHKWTIDWRLRPQANGWNSIGDPMVFETTTENAEDAIEKMNRDKTANQTSATQVKTTWGKRF